MSTATQLPIPTAPDWLKIARSKFIGFSHESIKGSGAFALVSRCPCHRRVILFETPAQRMRTLQRWDGQGGCSSSCTDAHALVTLVAE
jgi:hypothetical protein